MATRIMAMSGCPVRDALVVSGAGPYVDPWHDFAATSARLAAFIEDLGYRVDITGEVEDALADPGDVRLLVVNIGNPAEPRSPERMVAAAAGLARHLAGGGGLLGIHCSSTSLTGMREWPGILGGRWVRGRTMHPPQDECVVSTTPAAHRITRGLTDFTVVDERYSYLETTPDVTVLYEHRFEDETHPLVWAREAGPGRVVYDALGHHVGSYDAPGHRVLLERAMEWLTGAR
jgi:type 1 glutamine amidotransferase